MSGLDFKALQKPLLLLIAALAIGAAGVVYTHRLLQAANRELAQQQQQLREARTRLQKSGEEKDKIVRYLDSYRYLQQFGFVGAEQRINWIDGLRLANQKMQLFGVDYQVGAQQAYPYASTLDPGNLALHSSVMKIRLGLLHEGDLMHFLTTLAQQHAGVFSVRQCVITRADTGGSIRYQPNLHAECELSWITATPGTAAP